MWSNLLGAIVFALLCPVRSQGLTCQRCDKSTKAQCHKNVQEKCSATQDRCLVLYWGAGHSNKPNTYTMKCGIQDQCSEIGKRDLCAEDPMNCHVKCCAYSGCDPDYRPAFFETPGRSHHCHLCSSESLDSCVKSEMKCDDDQDACISFLMEGGNAGKVYTKRCARKDECTETYRKKLCDQEIEETRRKTCRSSCCFEQLCNTAPTTKSTLSLLVAIVLSFMFMLFC